MKSEKDTIITQSTKESTIQSSENHIIHNTSNESFKVYVRIRPYPKNHPSVKTDNSKKSITSTNNLNKNNVSENMIKVEKNMIYLEDIKNQKNKNNKTYIFDNIFNESCTNDDIFNIAIKSMIDKVLQGYNLTTLAYGVTGTGKTYTIFGDLSNNFKDEGIIFKACDYLFEKIDMNKNNENENYNIKVSYIEIYNEIVKDLINEKSPSLMIVEDSQKGVICPNIRELIIKDSVELKKIINESNKRRTMATTNQNQFSSRSHAILQMTLEKKIKKKEDNFDLISSKFLVVDLAGSERDMERGKRREEGVNINKSLFTLRNCLNILSEKSNTGKFVPYRDSKLTRILKDSLGGNILTVMLACISPCSYTYDETLSTLNYAFKAKKITKKIMKNIQEINVNNLQYKEMIDNLKSEISQLKKIIKNQELKLKQKNELNNNENFKNNLDYNTLTLKLNDSCESIESSLNMNTLIYNDFEEKIKSNNKDQKRSTTFRYNNKNEDGPTLDINIGIYNKYMEDIINSDLNIEILNSQIESIIKDKNSLENHLLLENKNNSNIINEYNSLKIIYDKYIEIVNEKLVESIEQNMIYNFNIKEIIELNISNENKVKGLESRGKQNDNLEEINYTKKNIIENNNQKEKIYEMIKRNNEQKEELKKLLLTLYENKAEQNSKYIHIIHEKEKLYKIAKQYKMEIDNFIKIQKQKEEDMVKITRKIEILNAKLKEKNKKIYELEKKGKPKYEQINIKLYKSNLDKNKFTNNNNNSKIKDNIGKQKSPHVKLKKIGRNNLIIKFNAQKKEKDNKSPNDKRRLTIFLNNENNNKLVKKYKKSLNRFKNNNNKENINKRNNSNDHVNKYNELYIPVTSITLYENKANEKPIYMKIQKENKNKKTDNKSLNKLNKGPLIKQVYKKYSSSINKFALNSKLYKKYSVKSVKIDLRSSNYTNEIIDNNTNNNTANNINTDYNLIKINEISPEKIKIDLTEADKMSSEQNLKEKTNNINLLNLKDKTMKNNHIDINIHNDHPTNINQFNNFSKSHSKSKKENYKKLSLKEARYENKIKYEKIPQPKNELYYAESFINEYKTNISKNKKELTSKIS